MMFDCCEKGECLKEGFSVYSERNALLSIVVIQLLLIAISNKLTFFL